MTDHADKHTPKHQSNGGEAPAGKLDAVKDAASKAISGVSGQAAHVFEQSRDTARGAARRTAGQIETNPLAVVAAGLGVGAIAAALVPRGKQERALLAPVGKRIAATGGAAIAAAKERGLAELEERGLMPDAIKEQARTLFDGLGKAVSGAGTAAADAARKKG